MPEYAAFLRGINVGGRTVKMDVLRGAFEALGYRDVRSVQASGNVLFSAVERGPEKLAAAIRAGLKVELDLETAVALRSAGQVREMVEARPFEGLDVTPRTRLYVTFLAGEPGPGVGAPFESQDADMWILRVEGRDVYSTVELSETRGTLDLMKKLEEAFGKNITTRNWNTVLKVADRLSPRQGE
jgi:uncharacterized protein (DUF1697 family)